MKRKGSFTIIAVTLSLLLVAANVFALDDLPSKPGLKMSLGGEYFGFKVKAYGYPTDIGVAGGYAGAEYTGQMGSKFLYAAGLDLGGAVTEAEEAHMNGESFSGVGFYGRATLKGAYKINEKLKVGSTASYLWLSEAQDTESGSEYGATWSEKLKIGPVSIMTVNALAQYSVMENLGIFGGYRIQLVDMAKVKFEGKASFGGEDYGYRDNFNVNPINTSGPILGAIYTFGKYEVGMQGGLLPNNAPFVNGNFGLRF